MHRVNFLVKNVDSRDPDYRVLSDREEQFTTFSMAMEFVRNLRSRLSSGEALIGQPQIEAA